MQLEYFHFVFIITYKKDILAIEFNVHKKPTVIFKLLHIYNVIYSCLLNPNI